MELKQNFLIATAFVESVFKCSGSKFTFGLNWMVY